MRVKNRKTIRNLSLRSFRASGKRNVIAAAAIALTTLLFTSLFTIVMSLNSSYQTYTFRQIGGYAHGTFKGRDGGTGAGHQRAQEGKSHRRADRGGDDI